MDLKSFVFIGVLLCCHFSLGELSDIYKQKLEGNKQFRDCFQKDYGKVVKDSLAKQKEGAKSCDEDIRTLANSTVQEKVNHTCSTPDESSLEACEFLTKDVGKYLSDEDKLIIVDTTLKSKKLFCLYNEIDYSIDSTLDTLEYTLYSCLLKT